jgi:ribA/ribD-fused uncharacterized protein
MTIKFYKSNDQYGYLNNFYPSKIFIYGKYYPTVEHAYQAQKTFSYEDRELIRKASTPKQARDLGQKVFMIYNWDDLKYDVMYDCILAKFTQYPDLREKLLSTNNEDIVENSPIDSWWGCGSDGTGSNYLGKILMRIRNLLRED